MKIPDPSGFTLRHRKRWEGTYHLKPLLWVMMSWFIDHAEWEDKTITIPGKKPIDLKRGQVVFSQRKLAHFFKIGRQQTRSHLDSMKKSNFITHQSTQGVSIATVVNYNKYQLSDSQSNPQSNRDPTHDPTHVPYNEYNKYNKRAGEKIASKKEKKQIADKAARSIKATEKYLAEKNEITPALKVSAKELKKRLAEAAGNQRINF